jgi:Ca-activated chloride channel family protein
MELKRVQWLTVVDAVDPRSHDSVTMNRSRTTALAFALIVGATLASAQSAIASDSSDASQVPVALVLDGSGSMWGRLDGEVKIDVARAVVRELATSWGDRIDLGLVTYGHRRMGDCTDIETLAVSGKSSTAELLSAVDGISPKGKTPLGGALEQAARDLRSRERHAVVTVISDGHETCGSDPCAIAARLRADGVDFVAHVIGFDTTEDENRDLRCIASATGGVFARATTRAELVEALGQVLTRTARPSGPATLVLTAAEGEQRQPIFEGVRWTVAPLDPQSDAVAAPMSFEGSPPPLELASGRYDVRAEYRGTTIEREIDLRPGETWREQILFGPGQLALRAVLSEGAPPIAEPIEWSVYPIGAFGRVAGEPVHEATRATCLTRLEAGRYEIRARFGDTERRVRIELRAGVIQPHTVDLEAGEARVFASLPPPGGPVLDAVEWTIRPLDERGNRADPVVERRTAIQTFVLPVGRYHVVGRHGSMLGEAVMRVEAGQSGVVTVVLGGDARPAAPGPR